MPRKFIYFPTAAAQPPQDDYPLDDYPQALFGFSYRKLSSTYNGPCLSVENTIDGTPETDINFVNDYVDLNAIVSNANGQYTTVGNWYNQRGDGNVLRRGNNTQRFTATDTSGNIVFIGDKAGPISFIPGNQSRFAATGNRFPGVTYPSLYAVYVFDPSSFTVVSPLYDIRYDIGRFRFFIDNANIDMRLVFLDGNSSETTLNYTATLNPGRQIVIFEVYTGPSEIGITVNGVGTSQAGSFAPVVTQNNYFIYGFDDPANLYLEKYWCQGRQAGLVNRINQYYNAF